MRKIELEYVEKMQNSRLLNRQLIMTLQSFNRLNEYAIKHNQLQCLTDKTFI